MAGSGGVPALPQTLTLDHVSPATRLLEKRRQMFEVQEALDAQKEEFARREEAFRRREEGLRKKDLDLQESLIRFNKFLQENESKRTRAEKRANDERKFREDKEVKVQQLLRKLEKDKAETKKKKEELAKNKKYQEYLEMVQDKHSDDYPEISNILDRFKTLKDADEALENRQANTERKMELQRIKSTQLQKMKSDEILQCNNQIAVLKKQLEASEAQVAHNQRVIDKARLDLREQTKELGQVLFAVQNLVNRCRNARQHDVRSRGRNNNGGGRDDGDDGMANDAALLAKGANWFESGGGQTAADLDAISTYIEGFIEIVEHASKEKHAYEVYDRPPPGSAPGAGGNAGAGGGTAQRGGGGGHHGSSGHHRDKGGALSPSASAVGSARESSAGDRSRLTNRG